MRCIMNKTKCTICGNEAIPIYGRIKIDKGEKEVYQFVRAGTWCPNRECGSIHTDFGVYTKEPTNMVIPLLKELLMKNKRNEWK